jgi:2-polyprenyl-3-methyl-5-hydroxy-6-metoxy-1,4-benzoquinol methylase
MAELGGNFFNKHESKNPLHRYLMRNFYASLVKFAKLSHAKSVHEVGCGEGYLLRCLRQEGFSVRGSDACSEIIETARKLNKKAGLEIEVKAAAVENLSASQDSAELIICCEVLEHLADPRSALRQLKKLSKRHIVLSVPWEPVWSVLNVARLKYLRRLGSTPGHVNRWSRSGFVRFVESELKVVKVQSTFPWTMLLCEVNSPARSEN